MYDHTASEDQVPWCLIAWRETLELKAREAPDLLKQWKVWVEGSRPRIVTVIFRNLRILL